jgi:anti-sigma factor (TIGR02949 family)
MECKDVLARLWEYLDEELGREEADSVTAHLSFCRQCHPAYCCDRALLELLARQRSACAAPPDFLVSLRVRLKQA